MVEPTRDYQAEGNWEHACDILQKRIHSLENDVLILALRLYGEDPNSLDPETADVMDRLRPRIDKLMGKIDKLMGKI